jgi:hypothetical protein
MCLHTHTIRVLRNKHMHAYAHAYMNTHTYSHTHVHIQTAAPIPSPAALAYVKDVSCGWKHTLAVTQRGDVYAWGVGAGGVLGLGHDHDVWTPTLVSMHVMRGSCTHVCARVPVYVCLEQMEGLLWQTS